MRNEKEDSVKYVFNNNVIINVIVPLTRSSMIKVIWKLLPKLGHINQVQVYILVLHPVATRRANNHLHH